MNTLEEANRRADRARVLYKRVRADLNDITAVLTDALGDGALAPLLALILNDENAGKAVARGQLVTYNFEGKLTPDANVFGQNLAMRFSIQFILVDAEGNATIEPKPGETN